VEKIVAVEATCNRKSTIVQKEAAWDRKSDVEQKETGWEQKKGVCNGNKQCRSERTERSNVVHKEALRNGKNCAEQNEACCKTERSRVEQKETVWKSNKYCGTERCSVKWQSRVKQKGAMLE
jgi:hypothetical protein